MRVAHGLTIATYCQQRLGIQDGQIGSDGGDYHRTLDPWEAAAPASRRDRLRYPH